MIQGKIRYKNGGLKYYFSKTVVLGLGSMAIVTLIAVLDIYAASRFHCANWAEANDKEAIEFYYEDGCEEEYGPHPADGGKGVDRESPFMKALKSGIEKGSLNYRIQRGGNPVSDPNCDGEASSQGRC